MKRLGAIAAVALCTRDRDARHSFGHVANDACVDHPTGPGADLLIIPHANTEV